MKKKYLAFFIKDLHKFSTTLTVNRLLIQKISESFEKLFIINTENLRFITKKINTLNTKDFFLNKKKNKLTIKNKNLRLPYNVEFFNPLNSNDFKRFMSDKDIIGINNFGRTLNELKVHILLKQHNIRQIQITNVGNLQTHIVPTKKTNLSALIYQIHKEFGHIVTVALSNLGLINKIDIRFLSDKKLINKLKSAKGFKNFLFNKLNLFYCNKHVLVNSNSYDLITSNKPIIKEEKIVLLDLMFEHDEWVAMRGLPQKKVIKDFNFKIKKLLNYLSNAYKKKVVVCIHPKDNLNNKKKIYRDYEVVKYSSKENILKAFLVLFFDTSAIADAIFLKKKIIFVNSEAMDKNQKTQGLAYHYQAGITKIDLENYNIKSKKELLNKLIKSKKKYFKYNQNYLMPDGKTLGYKKILKTIRKKYNV